TAGLAVACRRALGVRCLAVGELSDADDATVDDQAEPGAKARLDVAHHLLGVEGREGQDMNALDPAARVRCDTRRRNALERAQQALDLVLRRRAGFRGHHGDEVNVAGSGKPDIFRMRSVARILARLLEWT